MNRIYLGVEQEIYHSPDTITRRCIAHLLNRQVISARNLADVILNEVKEYKYIERVYTDGWNEEIVYYPFELDEWHLLNEELDLLFRKLRYSGFVPDSPCHYVGIHITVEVKKTQSIFIGRLLVDLGDKFLLFSGRKHSSTARADLTHMLNITNKYQEITDELVDKATLALESGIECLGFSFYKGHPFRESNRKRAKLLQFEHFGSTLNVSTFYAYLEFVHAVVSITADLQVVSSDEFDKYIESNSDTYPHLYDRYRKLPDVSKIRDEITFNVKLKPIEYDI